MEVKKIVEDLIDTFLKAGELSLSLREKGLTKEIKSDNTPVSNGDIEVNKFITKKISEITPDIPIISEETSDNRDNTQLKDFAASRTNVLVSFIKNKIRKQPNQSDVNKEEITEKFDQLVFGKDEQQLDYKIASCCNPIAGDDVFGFLTVTEGIKVHKKNCPNAVQLQGSYNYRVQKAKWIDSSQREFKAELLITGIDAMGLVNNVTKEVSNNLNIDMKRVHFDTDDGIFKGKIVVVVKNKNILDNLVQNIKKINGIDKVTRL